MTYLTDTSLAPAVQQPAADPNAASAAKLYPVWLAAKREPSAAPNAAVQAVRDADAVHRTLYDPVNSYGKKGAAVKDLVLALNFKANQNEIDALIPEYATMAADIGLDRNDLDRLTTVIDANLKQMPTKEMRDAYQRTAFKEGRALYGANFDRVLADGLKLAQRDPRFAKMLETTGAGDDPHLIARFCDLGQRARASGKLK